MQVLGDSIYDTASSRDKEKSHVIALRRDADRNPGARAWNTEVSRFRVDVEHPFGYAHRAYVPLSRHLYHHLSHTLLSS